MNTENLTHNKSTRNRPVPELDRCFGCKNNFLKTKIKKCDGYKFCQDCTDAYIEASLIEGVVRTGLYGGY